MNVGGGTFADFIAGWTDKQDDMFVLDTFLDKTSHKAALFHGQVVVESPAPMLFVPGEPWKYDPQQQQTVLVSGCIQRLRKLPHTRHILSHSNPGENPGLQSYYDSGQFEAESYMNFEVLSSIYHLDQFI